MKIDLNDLLVLMGCFMTLAGVCHFNPWTALIICGAYLMALGLVLARREALRQARGR